MCKNVSVPVRFCLTGTDTVLYSMSLTVFPVSGDYPAPRAVLTGHDHEVVCVSVCAELGLVISGAKGECVFLHI